VLIQSGFLCPPTLQKYGRYATWLDLWVTLTQAPPYPLSGLLGQTFKAGSVGASSAGAGTTASLSTWVA